MLRLAFLKKLLNNLKKIFLDQTLEIENFSEENIFYTEEDLERKFQEAYSAAKKELEAKKVLEEKKEIEAKKIKEEKEELEAKKIKEEKEDLERKFQEAYSASKKELEAKKIKEEKEELEVKEESDSKLPSIASIKASNDVDLVRSYLRDIQRVPLLSHEEEITLGRQVQKFMEIERAELEIIDLTGDKPSIDELSAKLNLSSSIIKKRLRAGQTAKERMVAANYRLVVSVAKKYTKSTMELLDLIQEGTIGLVRGIEKFDPARGYKFSTYAYWWIRQGITRAMAEKSRAMRLPIHITEMLKKLKKGQRELSQEISRSPTVSELAKYVELPEEDVKDLMCKAGQPVSLETKVGDGEDTVLLDLLAGGEDLPDEQIEMDCMRGDLHSLLHQLPDLQCRVLRMRYGMDGDEPMSLTGIGRVLGISRDRVRNLERDGLRGLRRLSDNVKAYFVS